MSMRISKTPLFVLVGLALLVAGCGKKETRPWSMMPNMHHQESVRPQEEAPDANNSDYPDRKGRAVRVPVEGTVPMDFSHYGFAKMDPKAAEQKNPLPKTMEVLKAGQRAFAIYCVVCHGERGDGDGNVIPNPATPQHSYSGREYKSAMQLPPPPPLHSDRVKTMTDGAVFNYITEGGALMPKYNHLNAEMRWSIVHYLRVLYQASHASDEQLKAYEAEKSKWADPTSREVVHDWRD